MTKLKIHSIKGVWYVTGPDGTWPTIYLTSIDVLEVFTAIKRLNPDCIVTIAR